MNEDFYENEIRKNMNQIDTLNSTAEISNDGKELHSIVDKMGDAITNTEKNIKDYSLYNMMNNNNDQTKTKPLERKLTDSKRRWKKLREKLKLLKKNNHNLNSIIKKQMKKLHKVLDLIHLINCNKLPDQQLKWRICLEIFWVI